eukprot:CAMPEP_0183332918 /NCGR_PEP_ID=MMETSP0164_2-20130417/1972_1 /TAXON_ID=221442 /ORGANISM="Coccolithus pelagicus ssp braarudi, Strain PLY182g" /LENGTH=96 /DNA_ID=CAMNT_0025501731 /DNA_START=1 /DNA_END=291 /DNA_ORIENTATION=-
MLGLLPVHGGSILPSAEVTSSSPGHRQKITWFVADAPDMIATPTSGIHGGDEGGCGCTGGDGGKAGGEGGGSGGRGGAKGGLLVGQGSPVYTGFWS